MIILRSFNRLKELDTKENQASEVKPASRSKESKEETEGSQVTQVISPRREAVQPPSWDSGRAQREVETKCQQHGERQFTDRSTRRCTDKPKAERTIYMQYSSIKIH